MFVLAKDVLVVCFEVVNKESGQVGGVSGEAGVTGVNEYVVHLGRRGSDCVGHVIVRLGPACVCDLVGVLVFDGGVGFFGVSIIGEVISALLLFDVLGSGFEGGSFVLVALELAIEDEGVSVIVLGVGEAVGEGVVISVRGIGGLDDGAYGVRVEFADGVAFVLVDV